MKKIITFLALILISISVSVSAGNGNMTRDRIYDSDKLIIEDNDIEPFQIRSSQSDNIILQVRTEENKQYLNQVLENTQEQTQERLQYYNATVENECQQTEESCKVIATVRKEVRFLGIPFEKNFRYVISENGDIHRQRGFFDWLVSESVEDIGVEVA